MTLDKNDHQNLLAVLSQAQFNGIQAAAAGVALFHKLQTIIAQPEVEADGDNDADGAKPGTPVAPGNTAA